MSPEFWALIVALVAQFAGLVWGAAKLSAAVSELRASVQELTATVRHIDARGHNHEVRLAVLEAHEAVKGAR